MVKREKDKTLDQTSKIICPECRRSTRHKIVASYDIEGRESRGPYFEYDWEAHYQIVECQGCETLSFRFHSMNSEDYEPDDEGGYQPISYQKLYPNRNADTLFPKDYRGAPMNIRRIYREVIESFNNELFTLCAGGLRAVIEGICVDKKIKGGKVKEKQADDSIRESFAKNMEGKIEGLHQLGFLARHHAEILHAHRYLGNSALHELEMPTGAKLKIGIEIVEHTLENIYELGRKARKMKDED